MGLFIVMFAPDPDEPPCPEHDYMCGNAVAALLAPLLGDEPTVTPYLGRDGEPIPVVEVDGLPPTLQGVIDEINNVIPLRPRQV